MVFEFMADGWDAPIAVEVAFTPAGVSAVSPDGFEFTGTYEQWAKFEAMGWARRAVEGPAGALQELAEIDRAIGL